MIETPTCLIAANCRKHSKDSIMMKGMMLKILCCKPEQLLTEKDVGCVSCGMTAIGRIAHSNADIVENTAVKDPPGL